MFQRVDVIISVDHKWRDMAGLVRLSRALERENVSSKLIRNGFELEFCLVHRPKAILIPHVFDAAKQNLAKRLQGMGVNVFILPTEGIPTLESYRFFGAGGFADLSGVTKYFAWNEEQKDQLKDNSSIRQSDIQVIGVPRFDFYHPKNSECRLSRKEVLSKYFCDTEKFTVLVATNFTQAQFFVRKQEFFKSQGDKLGFCSVYKKMGLTLEEVAARDFESRRVNINLLACVVEEFPEVNFLFKTHPSEDHEFYERLFEERGWGHWGGNVALARRELIWNLICNVDAEIARSCTTVLESWLLDKPTIQMGGIKDEWYWSEEHVSGSNIACDLADYVELIGKYSRNVEVSGIQRAKRAAVLKKFVSAWDGCRTEALANSIADNLNVASNWRYVISDLKALIRFFILCTFDYFGHDIRLFGFGAIFGKRVDSLNRFDKFIHRDDESVFGARAGTPLRAKTVK